MAFKAKKSKAVESLTPASWSVAQLETLTLMLSVLDQTDGGPTPTA
jgi:hypothetical protein